MRKKLTKNDILNDETLSPKDKCKEYAEYCKKVIQEVDNNIYNINDF